MIFDVKGISHSYLTGLVNNSEWLIFWCVSDDASCNKTHCSNTCSSLLLGLYKCLPGTHSSALKEEINRSASLEPQPKSGNIHVMCMCGEGAFVLSCNCIGEVFVGLRFSPLKHCLAASSEVDVHPFHVAAAAASFPLRKKAAETAASLVLPQPDTDTLNSCLKQNSLCQC